jgi:hypothetical protein
MIRKKIEAFTESEKMVVDRIRGKIKKMGYADDHAGVESTCYSLITMADLISTYPSILDNQSLGDNSRSVETLVRTLCSSRNLDLLLHTPTKAVLGRSFTIAKINFFLLLSYLCRDMSELCEHKADINEIISLNIFAVMAEDVFISIVSDMGIPLTVRQSAGLLLTRIWENRIFLGANDFAPILTELWEKRKTFLPAYGTMAGVSEVTTFCLRNNSLWLNFFEDDEFNDDRLESLKEYLMGLSYEEITAIQAYMKLNDIRVLDQTGIAKILDSAGAYFMKDYNDPREIYHFYTRRKENSDFREKSQIPGPKKTIEEYIMCYLLKKSG